MSNDPYKAMEDSIKEKNQRRKDNFRFIVTVAAPILGTLLGVLLGAILSKDPKPNQTNYYLSPNTKIIHDTIYVNRCECHH